MASTLIHLVRHGEVDNPDGVLYGTAPGFHLSARGRAMAQATAEYLASRWGGVRDGIVHLVSSTLERARETAGPIASALNLATVSDGRVIEAGNVFQGERVTIPFLLKPRNLARLAVPGRPSWGEPYDAIAERMDAAIADAVEAAAGAGAVIVSHQLPIWVVRAQAEGRGWVHDPRRRGCALGSVTTLCFADDAVAWVGYAEPARGV